MLISPVVESALIDLAHRGLWLMVHDGRLQIVTTRESTDIVPDALRNRLAAHRAELLEVIPRLESYNLALTGPVVRVLYARLSATDQERARNLQQQGDKSAAYHYFTTNYDRMGTPEKVIYLWAAIDGPRALPNEHAHITSERMEVPA